jgi:hypothetical protein
MSRTRISDGVVHKMLMSFSVCSGLPLLWFKASDIVLRIIARKEVCLIWEITVTLFFVLGSDLPSEHCGRTRQLIGVLARLSLTGKPGGKEPLFRCDFTRGCRDRGIAAFNQYNTQETR